MKPLKSYISEGIFNTDTSAADDLLNKETCLDAVLMLSGLGDLAVKYSARELAGNLYDKGSVRFDMEDGILTINPSPEIYSLRIDKKFISKYKGIIKCVMLLPGDNDNWPKKMHYISFDYDLNDVDMGGMTFKANRFITPSYLTLVNANLYYYEGSVGSVFIANKFKKVTIGIDSSFKLPASNPNEFLKSYYPKLIFVQTAGDKSDIFDGLALKRSSSCKFNVSLACTAAGREMREILKDDSPAAKREIRKIFGSNLNNIAEIDYMYTMESGSRNGEGHIYNTASGEVRVKEFKSWEGSDYNRAQRWQKADSALECE